MIHQPLGGAQGQCTDMLIQAKQIERTRDTLESLIAKYSGRDIDYVHTACERDNYLTAEQAKEFGLIDEIMYTRAT
jgi:ATP-dependent Clp protease protease subunit